MTAVAAGGAVSGTFPNPDIAASAVGPDQLGAVPFAKVVGDVQLAGGLIPSIAWTEAGNASETIDPFDMHSDAIPDRLTAPRAGYYYAHAVISWEFNTTGNRVLDLIHLNASGTVKTVVALDSRDSTSENPALPTIQSAG